MITAMSNYISKVLTHYISKSKQSISSGIMELYFLAESPLTKIQVVRLSKEIQLDLFLTKCSPLGQQSTVVEANWSAK